MSAAHHIHRRLSEFPPKLEIAFDGDGRRQTLLYERVEWQDDHEAFGLRYGENPDQPAALYRLINGNLVIGEVESLAPGRYLASDAELLQSGKRPGAINITDVDSALSILRYLSDRPCAVIIKHNNPSGVAVASSIAEAYDRAFWADSLAAFGGVVALNRPLDMATAELIGGRFTEVVVAPAYEAPALKRLRRSRRLRIMRIGNIAALSEYSMARVLDLRSLLDGGMVAQWGFVSRIQSGDDLIQARCVHNGTEYALKRQPTDSEIKDMVFGWHVVAGTISNAIVYVKQGVTVGIGAGEQDRVGAALIARDKALRKLAERLAWQRFGCGLASVKSAGDRRRLEDEAATQHGGLDGSVMVSDAFFPFADGVEVGIQAGVSAVLQPGGSIRDHEIIETCNRHHVAMMFSGQRAFRH